jgi:hypothetical protein
VRIRWLRQESIENAEISGTNQRTEDVFNRLNGHDTDIKIQVAQHDADFKNQLDQLKGKLDTAIQLLLTPQGKHAG